MGEAAELALKRDAVAEEVRQAEERVRELRTRAEQQLRDILTLPEHVLQESEIDLENHPVVLAWKELPRDYNLPKICERVTKLCKDLNELHERVPHCVEQLEQRSQQRQ
eukprot:TRINITY_DN33645_c0_g1_i1.p2 TRINITY_DN33645_c0_g1~~TRINITY_DN33645_c0_g1_i1.p2  ORF type:complete len:109 (+),score=38.44 TRINITY_DN33645_c0_g1_i1:151-477(+)